LSSADAARAWRVLEKLSLHGLHGFHLTGRLAMEAHRVASGDRSASRALNDIDIVVPSFAAVPEALARGFLVRHIHPKAPEGKIVVQLVDAEEALRIDVFSAYGSTLTRSRLRDSPIGVIPVVSAEDLAARSASLVMELERGQEVARKHAEDFEWLAEFVDPAQVEIAWQDHRRENDPSRFREAWARIRDMVPSCATLLVTPDYSQDADAICPRCEETGAWRLASGQDVMAILGYV
jgi:hypothetical protein